MRLKQKLKLILHMLRHMMRDEINVPRTIQTEHSLLSYYALLNSECIIERYNSITHDWHTCYIPFICFSEYKICISTYRCAVDRTTTVYPTWSSRWTSTRIWCLRLYNRSNFSKSRLGMQLVEISIWSSSSSR